MTFADRIQKHCFAGGALTEERSVARLRALTGFVEEAVLAEAGRWGRGFTPDEHWRAAVATLQRRMEDNVSRLILALRAEPRALYPNLDAPEIYLSRGTRNEGLRIEIGAPNGTTSQDRIYYTIDGTDPRELWTGRVSVSASPYLKPLTIEGPVIVRARSRVDETWSALTEATFEPTSEPAGAHVLPGDVQLDGLVNLADAIDLLTFLFRRGVPHVLGTKCIAVTGCRTPAACG